jgi:hypothetical protein
VDAYLCDPQGGVGVGIRLAGVDRGYSGVTP